MGDLTKHSKHHNSRHKTGKTSISPSGTSPSGGGLLQAAYDAADSAAAAGEAAVNADTLPLSDVTPASEKKKKSSGFNWYIVGAAVVVLFLLSN